MAGGEFHASPLFDLDPVRTAEEIVQRGADTLAWLLDEAAGAAPPQIDIHLIRGVHRRWFESTFPDHSGRERNVMVANRKATAVEVPAIVPAVYNACDNWNYRFVEVVEKASGEEQIELLVAEANTLAVRIYDIHPFLDGNTRTTFHLRNYALVLGGTEPLLGLHDEERHMEAWMAATPHDHRDLDDIVLETLIEQQL